MLGFSQKEKDMVLRAALRSENIAALKKALERGGNPNAAYDEDHGKPIIVWLAEHYYSRTAERMLEVVLQSKVKVDVDQPDRNGNTALMRAIESRNSTCASMLLQAGADMLAKNQYGMTPFSAALRNNDSVAQKMLEQGVLERFKAAEDSLAVHRLVVSAIENGRDGWLARKLIDAVENINDGAASGISLLHTAVRHGRESVVAALLDRPEADIDVRDRQGRTPLHAALANGQEEMARQLIDKGAAVHMPDAKGAAILTLAAKSGSIPVTRLVLRKLAAQKIKPDLDAALLAAAEAGHARLVDVMIEAGADKDAANEKGETPLILATRGGHMEALRMLTVKHAADTQKADKTGMIAYDHAKKSGNGETTEYLVKFQPGYVPPPPPPPPVDTSRFSRTSDYSIDVKEKGLTMTFNFWTQQVIYREPEKGVIAHVRNFDEIQRKEAIAEAYETLKRLGGRPPECQAVEVQKKSLGAAMQKPKASPGA